MLTEVTAIVLMTLVASGLAILGVLDLLWPTHPRRPARTSVSPPATSPSTAVSLRSSPTVEASPIDSPPTEASIESRLATTGDEMTGGAPVSTVIDNDRPKPPASLIETCLALYDAGRFDKVVSTAMPALTEGTAMAAADTAVLWGVLGRARWALHDGDGARSALQCAVEVAAADARASSERQLRSIALVAADDLLVRGRAADDGPERLALLRSAREWVRAAELHTDPDGEGGVLAGSVEAEYWRACESDVRASLSGGNFSDTRRLVADLLHDERVPAAERATLVELAADALDAEVGDLAASAIESMQRGREWEALRVLEHAEELTESASVPSPGRRDEINRRLWWAYTRLGVARIDAEDFEQALDPLSRALRVAGKDPDRREETGSAMVRALAGLVNVRAATIREVVAGGHGEAGRVQAERLWALLQNAIAAGAPEQPLAGALATSRALLEELGRTAT